VKIQSATGLLLTGETNTDRWSICCTANPQQIRVIEFRL